MKASATPGTSKRQRKAVAAFARRARLRKPALLKHLEPDAADRALTDAQRQFEALCAEACAVPKGVLNGALRSTYEMLAYAKALRAHGMAPAAVGEFFDDSYRLLAGRVPGVLRRRLFRWVSPWLERRLRREAGVEGSGWRYEVRDSGKGELAFDVLQCPVCRVFEEHDQRDVVPFVCALDDTMSELFDMGLERSGTRALGAERCDFRYRPGQRSRPLRSLRSFPVVDR